MEMSSQSIKSYVISLETAQQRREHITQEFSDKVDKVIVSKFLDIFSPSEIMDETVNELMPALFKTH